MKNKCEEPTGILYPLIKAIWEQGKITEKTKEIRANGPQEERFIIKQQELNYRYHLTRKDRERNTPPF